MTRGFRCAQARYDAAEPDERGEMVDCPACGGSGEEEACDNEGSYSVRCSACGGEGEVDRPPIVIVARVHRRRRPRWAVLPCGACEGGWTTSPLYFSPDVGGWVADRMQCEECGGAGNVPLQIPPEVPVHDRRPVPAPTVAPWADVVDDDLPF